MSDEITTEVETEPTVEVVAEEVPALTDEAIAAALGVDVEYLKEVKPQLKNLGGFYGKVNKRNVELIEAQRAAEARAVTPTPAVAATDDDEELELDEKSQRVLKRFIEAQIAPFTQTVQASVETEMGTVIEAFADANPTVDAMRVDELMTELELWVASTTPAKLKKNLERAAKIVRAEAFDPEAEVGKRTAEKLKDAVKDGERVVDVKAKRTAIEHPRSESDIVLDKDIPWHKRMDAFSKD